MSAEIQYNTRVTQLEPRGDKTDLKIRVEYENFILKEKEFSPHDLVVIAMPFSALRHVRMKRLAGYDLTAASGSEATL